MAELGVAASGIAIASIAIQVGDSILKLKSFWVQVKEAPEEIKLLIEEIEMLDLVLSELGSGEAADSLTELEPTCAKRCLELCRKGAGILETTVKELDEKINKRKRVGSFQAVLKKGVVERLKERLRSAQFMLMLSNQAYSEALQKQRHELQRQWAELQQRELSYLKACVSQSSNAESTEEKSESGSLDQTIARVKQAQTEQRSFIATFSVPRWLFMTNWALEISGAKAPCGWNYYIRSYSIVPDNAIVMKYARQGDVPQIRRLLTEGKASLSDRNQYRESILDVAAEHGRLELVKFLMSQNASFLQLRVKTLYRVSNVKYRSRDELLDMLRMLISQLALDDLSPCKAWRDLTSRYFGDADLLSWIIPQLGYSLQSLTQRERTQYSTNIFSREGVTMLQPDAANLIRLFFMDEEFDPVTCSLTDRNGMSLLHGIAANINLVADGELPQNLVTAEYTMPWKTNVQQRSEMLLVARELIAASPTRLHGLTLRYDYRCFCTAHFTSFFTPVLQTPLMMVVSGFFLAHSFGHPSRTYENWRNLADRATSSAIVWLQQLHSAGVDLLEYGRTEKEIHSQKKVSKEWTSTRGTRMLLLRLISFTYGPEPADWKFWFSEGMEVYFVQFWDMVDHPERALPGAWIEGQHEEFCLCVSYDPEFEEEVTEEDCDVVE